MVEANSRKDILPFDILPELLRARKQEIEEKYDGTLAQRGITMILNPQDGKVIQAVLVDLLDGRITIYQPLDRGKWSSVWSADLKSDTYSFAKLNEVEKETRKKLEAWKELNRNLEHPPRQWSVYRFVKANKSLTPEWKPEGSVAKPKKRVPRRHSFKVVRIPGKMAEVIGPAARFLEIARPIKPEEELVETVESKPELIQDTEPTPNSEPDFGSQAQSPRIVGQAQEDPEEKPAEDKRIQIPEIPLMGNSYGRLPITRLQDATPSPSKLSRQTRTAINRIRREEGIKI